MAIERVGEGQQDVDSDDFAGDVRETYPIPSTSGDVAETQINLTSVSQRDNLAAVRWLLLQHWLCSSAW